jgi:FkbM family methyltransferase
MNLISCVHNFNIPVTGIIQVGASIGHELYEFRNLSIDKVVMFEPLSWPYQQLLSKIQTDKRFKAYQYALGSAPGIAEMFVADNDQQSSSLLDPAPVNQYYPSLNFTHKETVEIKLLDDFLAETSGCNCLLIDTQGYETEVLRGATETLKQIDCVFLEVSRVELYKNNARMSDIDQILSTYGLHMVADHWHHPIHGDAFYMKKS